MQLKFFMETGCIDDIQHKIGYDFKNKRLLAQAFTRKSYAEEKHGTLHNEVLEFYGDKALEFIVMKKMSEYYGKIEDNETYSSLLNEGELTEVKKKLVCREMLAHKIRNLGFQAHLIIGTSDYIQRIWKQESVQEDLFEAILGAVAIDSSWNVDVLTKVVDHMLTPEFHFKDDSDKNIDYVQLIQQWCQKKYGILPRCAICNCVRTFSLLQEYNWGEKNANYQCDLTIGPFSFQALGKTQSEAKIEACKKAYLYLEKNRLLFTLRDEIGEPDIDRAINQLQELYQKGYISEPRYEFSEKHDTNGNPVWECHCYLDCLEQGFELINASKKQAKKEAAYRLVWLYLGEVKHDEA
ncbi:MAG: hypothetical protein IJX80_06510 [Clostridia bacterium]|nr:hypothetical protein [Clostridia bacterium]